MTSHAFLFWKLCMKIMIKNSLHRLALVWNTRSTHFMDSFCWYTFISFVSLKFHFPYFLTVSYRFPWCFRIFPLVFLRFPWVFLLSYFPSVFSLYTIFDFAEKWRQLVKDLKFAGGVTLNKRLRIRAKFSPWKLS